MKMYETTANRDIIRPPGMAALVSASRDGAFLAAILERFGVQPCAGRAAGAAARRCSS